jgi:hypothetical protein
VRGTNTFGSCAHLFIEYNNIGNINLKWKSKREDQVNK